MASDNESFLSLMWSVTIFVAAGGFFLASGIRPDVVARAIHPMHWSFYAFIGLLLLTVDWTYFPTAGLLMAYLCVLFVTGTLAFPPLSLLALGTVAWVICGGLWLKVKWWSYLHDPKNEQTIKAIPDGQDTKFFLSRLTYLYPHFLYWPLSIPHTVVTKLLFQIFEAAARRLSGSFGRMVAARKEELKNE